MNSDIPAKFTYHRIGVGGLCLRDNKILLVKHKYGISKGKWIIPGGFVDLGESVSKAIEREIYEETSILTRAQNIVAIRHLSRDRESGGLVSDLFIVFKVEYISGKHKASDLIEIEETCFYPIENIDDLEIAAWSRFILEEVLNNKGFNLLSYRPEPSTSNRLKIHSYELYG